MQTDVPRPYPNAPQASYAPRPYPIAPSAPYAPPVAFRKPGKEGTRQFAMSVATMVMIIVSVSIPWYTLSQSSGSGSSTTDYTFGGISSHGGGRSSLTPWGFYTGALPGLYSGTLLFMMLALLFAILSVVLFALTWFGKPYTRFLKLFMNLVVLFIALAVVIFALAHAWAYNEMTNCPGDVGPHKTLIGSHSAGGVSTNWYPSIGWFTSIGTIALVAVLSLRIKRMGPAPD